MKKILVYLSLIAIFTVNISAISPDSLNVPDDFIIYSENPAKVAEILSLTEAELKEKTEKQETVFLAVNENNTKQIQLSVAETDFSKAVQNFSNLSDDSIKALLPEITGLSNVKGEILSFDSNKYVKINLKTEDNSYILTQYFSVIDTKLQTLSFYTDSNESTDYIENVFPKEKETKTDKDWISYLYIAGIVVFGAVCIILVYVIIRDLICNKNST